MLPRSLIGLFAVFSLALSGCALSPQSLNPQPRLNVQLTAVGQGQPVSGVFQRVRQRARGEPEGGRRQRQVAERLAGS